MQTLPELTPQAQELWDASNLSRLDLANLLRLIAEMTRRTVFLVKPLDLLDLADNLHPQPPTLPQNVVATRSKIYSLPRDREILLEFLDSLES
jgi:hypothetical protein